MGTFSDSCREASPQAATAQADQSTLTLCANVGSYRHGHLRCHARSRIVGAAISNRPPSSSLPSDETCTIPIIVGSPVGAVRASSSSRRRRRLDLPGFRFIPPLLLRSSLPTQPAALRGRRATKHPVAALNGWEPRPPASPGPVGIRPAFSPLREPLRLRFRASPRDCKAV